MANKDVYIYYDKLAENRDFFIPHLIQRFRFPSEFCPIYTGGRTGVTGLRGNEKI